MMTGPDTQVQILVHPSADAVAEAIAARLIARVGELQDHRGAVPQICLTGGRIATKAYQHLTDDGPRSQVDWGLVGFWWGDERWVRADSEDRNDGPVLEIWRDALPLNPDRVHPMPSTMSGISLDDAAARYAGELGETCFDICLLGVGPDGHVNSIFPEHPSAHAEGRVIAVRSSPKPPPDRISLTLEVVNQSREVWFCVSGADKADAVAMALLGAGDVQVPAGGARGTERSIWLLDPEAASRLPKDLIQRGVI